MKKILKQLQSNKSNHYDRRNDRGQIVLEYLLLMVIVVSVATVLTQKLVHRSSDESSQGMVIKGWNKIINVLGYDLADCSNQTDFKSANCKQ